MVDDQHSRSPDDQSELERGWRRRFEERGRRYRDEAGIAGWSTTGLEARFRRFQRVWHTPSVSGMWLDVGCGAGTYSRFLRAEGLEVIGMDYSLPSLVQAQQRSADVDWCVADVRALPVASATLDGVLCFGVMQALSDPVPAVRELVRSLRRDGEIWIDGLNRRCLPTMLRELVRVLRGRPRHLRYDDPARLRRCLEQAGVNDLTLHWLPLLPGRAYRLQFLFESRAAVWLFQRVPGVGALVSHSFLLHGRRAGATARQDG